MYLLAVPTRFRAHHELGFLCGRCASDAMHSNTLQRAIHDRFGPENVLVKLSELIFFIGNWELSQSAKTNTAVGRSATTNTSADSTNSKDTLARRTTAKQKHNNPKSALNKPQAKPQAKLPTRDTTNTSNTSNTSGSTSNTIDTAISIDSQPSTSLDKLSRGSEKA